jgi:hypothetical protein
VITLDILLKKVTVGEGLEQEKFQGQVITQGSRQGCARIALGIQDQRVGPPRGSEAESRQRGQPSPSLQLLEERITLPSLEPYAGPSPVQQFTEGAGKFGEAEAGEIVRNLANQLQVVGRQRTTADSERTPDGHGHDAASKDRRTPCLPYRKAMELSREILQYPQTGEMANLQIKGSALDIAAVRSQESEVRIETFSRQPSAISRNTPRL